MLDMLQDLVRHKWHANASLLRSIREHDAAARDEELRKLLHHTLITNRYWLMLSLQKEFDREKEGRLPDTLDALVANFRDTSITELDWLFQLPECDLLRQLRPAALPGHTYSVAEALIQVCLHSHGHRAQCATRLRTLGGTPPMTDFIAWAGDKPDPEWPTRS
jgi:uncharacterized damage-inducible protein DinB